MKAIFLFLGITVLSLSCISKKEFTDQGYKLETVTNDIRAKEFQIAKIKKENALLNSQIESEQQKYNTLELSKNTMESSFRDQIEDLKKQRDQQYSQVGNLTDLSKSANDNMNQTVKQLAEKDKYIQYLYNSKDRVDSLNLALALNLKSALRKGIEEDDINVKVDKTVVYIELSDKLLFNYGTHTMTYKADEPLSEIAQILKSSPELDVMVEGYTDNVKYNNSCITDSWDLSAKRSTQLARALQTKYGVNPDKLIAAGRGEYNSLADNATIEGREMNRRTRIVLLPKLDHFYDLIKPISGK